MLKSSLLLLVFTLTSVPAWAQPNAALSGRVFDEDSGLSLDGVIVEIEGTALRTVTRRSGAYNLNNVPEGSQRVRFQYVGASDLVSEVMIASGLNTLDVRMGAEVLEMEPFVVEGMMIGQARAINLQRSATTLANFVSADAIGRFPDQNAAEALSRLPGVSVERDQGEGRYVVIRGIDPNLNSVAIDGVKLASPSTGDRATLLDTIPSDNLQSIEVYKSVLPSQPGDSVGGYVNIRTPSAFDDEVSVRRLTLQTNYSDLVDKWRGKVAGAFGTNFADGKVGLMISASYEEREFGSDNKEADPWIIEDGSDGTEGYVSEEIVFREYDIERRRTGISANLEFKPSPQNYYYIRGSWNEYKDTEIRHQAIFEMENFREITQETFIADETTFIREMKERTEKMRIFALSAGGENQIGDLTVDYRISFSQADEDTPFDFETVYEFADPVAVRFSRTRSYLPVHEQIGGPSLKDPANYEFDGLELANQIVEEKDLSGELNFKYDLDRGSFRSVQFGGLVRSKKKESDERIFEEDDNPPEVDTLAGFVYTSPRDPYNSGLPYVSTEYTRFFNDNRGTFDLEFEEVDSIIEDFTSDEDVYAAYLMGTFDFNEWQVILGARLERTRFRTSGVQYNDDTEAINPVSARNSYTNFLPGLHIKRTFGDDWVFRFSANKTISRPSFEQTIPNAEIEDDEVTVGNPMLDPLESINLDISVEYYLRPLGVFSAAVFYKDIKNFIYEQVSEGVFPGVGEAEITTFRNGPSGDILGLELAYQRQLTFLPDPFDGFGVYANLTLIDATATVLGPEEGDPNRDLPFIKQPSMIANLAITYEKRGLFLRLAYSYRDKYLDEVGEEFLEDRYIASFGQVDFSASYRVNRHLTVFANWVNITNEPFRAYFSGSNRLSQFEEYGWSLNAGVKLSF